MSENHLPSIVNLNDCSNNPTNNTSRNNIGDISRSSDENSPSFSYYLNDQRGELTEILRSRLIECGWRDQVANMCRNLIQRHGVEQIRLEQMINEVGPKARQNIPDQVKAELLDIIRKDLRPQVTGLTDQQSKSTQPPLQKQTITESHDDSVL